MTTNEFIFDIVLSSKFTEQEVERLKKEHEELKKQGSSYQHSISWSYHNVHTLCQVKIIPSDGSVVTAMWNAKEICEDIIKNNKDNNFFHTDERMNNEVYPKLSKFVYDEITAYTVGA